MRVEQKNQTRFAAELREAFEHILNYVATESDSDMKLAQEALSRAEYHIYPTHYEKSLLQCLYTAMEKVNTVAEYTVKKNYEDCK